jgi:hypothetical protein
VPLQADHPTIQHFNRGMLQLFHETIFHLPTESPIFACHFLLT